MDASQMPMLPGMSTKRSFVAPQASQTTLSASDSQKLLKSTFRTSSQVMSESITQEESPVHRSIALDRKVLQFTAYFKEAVPGSPDEAFRVRKVLVAYFLEDDTIQMTEPTSANAGLPQGTFVKRHRIPNTRRGGCFTLDDLRVGNEITVYGRVFRIVDANGSTRRWMAKDGIELAEAEEIPESPFDVKRAEHMQRETGQDTTINRGSKMNPMKKFMEASLGKFSRNPESLRQFLENDRKVLMFKAIWDQRSQLYAGISTYKLNYFLTDDTVEVCEEHAANSGADPFPKLLARNKLPKDYTTTLFNENAIEEEGGGGGLYYSWKDFMIGEEVNVFGRNLKIVDCDRATRDYCMAAGIDLGPPIEYAEPKKEIPKMPIPPHEGGLAIGSEEDTLGSCLSLRPSAPKRDFAKMDRLAGCTLSFGCRMESAREDDKDRKFSLQYFLADDSMKIYEPPQKNTGIVGGQFLSRNQHRKPDGSKYVPQDFYVGTTVNIRSHRFRITDIDEATLQFMEGHKAAFPLADAKRVIAMFREKLRERSDSVAKVFRLIDSDKSNEVTIDEMRQALTMYGLPEHAAVTIMRYFDDTGDGKINLEEFKEKVMDQDYGGSDSHKKGGIDLEALGNLDNAGSNDYEATLANERKQKMLATTLRDFSQAFINNKGRLTQSFRMLDTNFSGTVDRHEFGSALSVASDATNFNLTSEQIKLMQEYFYPEGGDPELDYSEFSAILWNANLDAEDGKLGNFEADLDGLAGGHK